MPSNSTNAKIFAMLRYFRKHSKKERKGKVKFLSKRSEESIFKRIIKESSLSGSERKLTDGFRAEKCWTDRYRRESGWTKVDVRIIDERTLDGYRTG